jgi:hypothetical protein
MLKVTWKAPDGRTKDGYFVDQELADEFTSGLAPGSWIATPVPDDEETERAIRAAAEADGRTLPEIRPDDD